MKDNIFHIVAFFTVAIWGTTFVWTKLLIINGLSPAQIFTLRFIIAYVMLTAFSLLRPLFLRGKLKTAYPEKWRKIQHKWVADNWRDELVMAALGVTGGSLYFLSENEALRFTTATNVSLAVMLACPTAVSGYTLANQCGADGELAGQLVVVTTVFSVVTMFFTIWLLTAFALI